MKTFDDRFDEKCILTIDGKCKYWNPEAFGYEKGYNKCSLDKFFPEEIKQFFKEELKRITDLMIGEERKELKLEELKNMKNFEKAFSAYTESCINIGINKHQQHCIDIINKHLKQ